MQDTIAHRGSCNHHKVYSWVRPRKIVARSHMRRDPPGSYHHLKVCSCVHITPTGLPRLHLSGRKDNTDYMNIQHNAITSAALSTRKGKPPILQKSVLHQTTEHANRRDVPSSTKNTSTPSDVPTPFSTSPSPHASQHPLPSHDVPSVQHRVFEPHPEESAHPRTQNPPAWPAALLKTPQFSRQLA